jgi:hypothetical protein
MLCNESSPPPAPGTSYLRTPLMLAIRRWCAPGLGLEPHAPIEEYLALRRQLGGMARRLSPGLDDAPRQQLPITGRHDTPRRDEA